MNEKVFLGKRIKEKKVRSRIVALLLQIVRITIVSFVISIFLFKLSNHNNIVLIIVALAIATYLKENNSLTIVIIRHNF